MNCDKCEADMDSMGYGDYLCPECGRVKYAESEGDFEGRISGELMKVAN